MTHAEEVRERMRKKVRTVGRMCRLFKTIRQEHEIIVRLKGVCPGHKLAPGLLLAGKERLHSEMENFMNATQIDVENEKRPEVEGGKTRTSVSAGGDIDFVNAGPDDDEVGNPDATDLVAPAITTEIK